MSNKEIAQTVGSKRFAWLVAIIAAFAVFATIGSQWRTASASELNSADNSQTVLATTASTSADSVNLPDIRGSTDGAVATVANFTEVVGSTVSTVNVPSIAEPGFWAFVAVTVAFVVLLRVANMGTLVECAEPRYVRRQDLGMYGHRARKGNSPPNSLAARSTWLRTTDTSGISKRSGLKRASHVTIARDTLLSANTTTTSRKTHPVTSAIFGRLHAAFITFVGAVRTSNSYFRRAIASAGTAMISSLKRFGAGSAYPLIAHTSFVRVAGASRTSALATLRHLSKSEFLHQISFDSFRRKHSTLRDQLSSLMNSQSGNHQRPAFALRL